MQIIMPSTNVMGDIVGEAAKSQNLFENQEQKKAETGFEVLLAALNIDNHVLQTEQIPELDDFELVDLIEDYVGDNFEVNQESIELLSSDARSALIDKILNDEEGFDQKISAENNLLSKNLLVKQSSNPNLLLESEHSQTVDNSEIESLNLNSESNNVPLFEENADNNDNLSEFLASLDKKESSESEDALNSAKETNIFSHANNFINKSNDSADENLAKVSNEFEQDNNFDDVVIEKSLASLEGETDFEDENKNFDDQDKADFDIANLNFEEDEITEKFELNKNFDSNVKSEKISVETHANENINHQKIDKKIDFDLAQTNKINNNISTKFNLDDIEPEKVIDQIKFSINKLGENGNNSMQIKLEPRELGKIDIKMDNINNVSKITFVVEKSETLDLLKNDVNSLHKALEYSGIKTSDANLSFNLQDSNNMNQQNEFANNASHKTSEKENHNDNIPNIREYSMSVVNDGIDIRV